MIKNGAILAGLIFLFGLPAWPQNQYPKAEVFGGFSYLRSAGEDFLGWQASVAGNFHKSVGVVGDFGGQYKSISGVSLSVYEFLGGPSFAARSGRVTGFGHILVGGVNTRAGYAGISATRTSLALGAGGGLDVNISKHVAIRVVQVDYIPFRLLGVWQTHNVRCGAGVVFKIGGK